MVRASIETDSHAWTFASFSRKVRLRAASASSAGGGGHEASAGDDDEASGALTPARHAAVSIPKTAASISAGTAGWAATKKPAFRSAATAPGENRIGTVIVPGGSGSGADVTIEGEGAMAAASGGITDCVTIESVTIEVTSSDMGVTFIRRRRRYSRMRTATADGLRDRAGGMADRYARRCPGNEP